MGGLLQREIHTISGKKLRFTWEERITDMRERNPIVAETGYMGKRRGLNSTSVLRDTRNEAKLLTKNTIMRNHDFTKRNLPKIGIEKIIVVKLSI